MTLLRVDCTSQVDIALLQWAALASSEVCTDRLTALILDLYTRLVMIFDLSLLGRLLLLTYPAEAPSQRGEDTIDMGRQQRRDWVHFLAGHRHAVIGWQSSVSRTFNSPFDILYILCFGAILLLFVGCAKEEQIVEEVRSLKTITIGETTASQERRFSGVVRAVDRSGLSFEVPGNVLIVNVDIGANVEKEQILAELDKEPYELEVQKAQAELDTAKAKVRKQLAEYERQKRLLEQGAGAQNRVERAEFAFKEAEASVEFTQSALDLAKRDLGKTVLYAPFNGTIGVRQVEPFVDVRRGQKLFEIDAEGEQESRGRHSRDDRAPPDDRHAGGHVLSHATRQDHQGQDHGGRHACRRRQCVPGQGAAA